MEQAGKDNYLSQCASKQGRELCQAYSEDLFQIAYLHSAAPAKELINSLLEVNFPFNLALEFKATQLQEDQYQKLKSKIKDGLLNIPKPLNDDIINILSADFSDIYLNYTFGLSPNESVWIDDDKLILQEPTFQVRKIYADNNIKAADWRMRSEDHIVSELEFLAILLNKADNHSLNQAADFMDLHVLRWMPEFCQRVSSKSATVYFAGLSELTLFYINQLRFTLEELTGRERMSLSEVEAKTRKEKLVKIGGALEMPQCGPGCGPAI